MKRKIALLLAVSSIMSLWPTNLFATSTNSLTKIPAAVGDKTAFVEQGVLTRGKYGDLSTTVLEIDKNDDVKYVVEAPNLEVEAKNTIAAGSTLRLQLDNARWFFRASTAEKWGGVVTGNALRWAELAKGSALTDAEKTLGDPANVFGLSKTNRPVVIPGEPADTLPITIASNVYTRYEKGYVPIGSPATDDPHRLFVLTVSGADDRTATLEFPNEIVYKSSGLFHSASIGGGNTPFDDPEAPLGKFWIPLVVRSTGDSEDVRVTIADNNSTISGGSWVFGTTTATMTRTYVDDPQTSRDEFPINRLVIKELRVGSMGTGSVEIIAPSGFEFTPDFLANAEVIAENFGYGVTHTMAAGEYTLDFRRLRNEYDYSTLVLTFHNLSSYKSNRVAGAIYIRDKNLNVAGHVNTFRLIADENAGWGDINLRIRNSSGSDIVTNESFLAGSRKDWTMNLYTIGAIPTLVNGRYEDDDSYRANDDSHLAAKVAFYENTTNAWGSSRSTTFTLPEEVKIRKMEITKAKNVVQEDILKNPTTHAGYYMNTGKLENYVTINGNTITLRNIQVTAGKKAEIEMNLWVSIASGYQGDISLTAAGSAVSDTLEPVIIAKAVNPVEIKTTVNDVRIGYQYYPVADIELTETAAGMLERGKQVWLSVTDRIHMDMYFTPGFTTEVTEGNLKLKNVDIASGNKISVTSSKITNASSLNLGSGTISFDVDGASSTASTVKFSNLQLKIDRTVPESSQSAYSVYAWGPNIAPNADIFDYASTSLYPGGVPNYVGKDQHGALGISAPYVRVVTSATDKNTVLSSIVKVTAGSGTGSVNGETVTIDPPAFIDTASNRMQVPVRSVATLLGVREEQIIWSNTDRTVTINMVNRTIQFAIGSDLMLVNGAQVRMDTAAMIVNGRTFIPFKYLGDALGVTVTYDDSSRTAIFNEGTV